MARLWVYMNGYRVGTFTKTTSGAHQFQYDESWVKLPGSRPISHSMPLYLSINTSKSSIGMGLL